MYENWEELKKDCLACKKCSLCQTRQHVVFGVGNPASKILFIGEAPGQQEDETGEPFVGRGGKLLDKFLEAVDLDRKKDIYIANTIKCRPPNNRDPSPEEQAACLPWLRSQYSLIHPKIVVCLGRIAAMRIIRPDFKIMKEHGIFFEKKGVQMMATPHPAALLRSPNNKSIAFEDFLALRKKIDELSLEES